MEKNLIDPSLASAGFKDESIAAPALQSASDRLRLACMIPRETPFTGYHEQDLIYYGTIDDLVAPQAAEVAAMEYIHNNNLLGFGISDVSSPIPITTEEVKQVKDVKNPNELYKVKVTIRGTVG